VDAERNLEALEMLGFLKSIAPVCFADNGGVGRAEWPVEDSPSECEAFRCVNEPVEEVEFIGKCLLLRH
jgi:hypothetical protein